MLIDWFTVGAQILNFLILVWLLKRFLYHPILNAVDAREQRIARELADADAAKAGAGQERETFQRKNATFDKERAALLSQATEAANTERQHLLDAARQEAISLSARQRESLRSETQALQQEIFRRTQEQVLSIARKALTDLAGVTLEERMLCTFAERLRALGADEKQTLADALRHNALPIVVHSAFELSVAQRSSLTAELQELLGPLPQVSFKTAPELVSGIELATDGQKVAWSIAHYLTELESTIGAQFLVDAPANGVSRKEDANAQ